MAAQDRRPPARGPVVGLTAPGGPRAPGARRVGCWLVEGATARGVVLGAAPDARARIVVVPAHEGPAARELRAALTVPAWRDRTVAVVAYGRRPRRARAVDAAREALDAAGAQVLPRALGVDVAALRGGAVPAEELFRAWLLDDLVAAVPA